MAVPQQRAVTAVPAPKRPTPSAWNDSELTLAWIGHSTVLINFHGVTILTDPILFDRIGVPMFGTVIGPGRLTEPALAPEELPVPDIVLLSHAHMDHMDYPSLAYLTQRSPGQIDCLTSFNTMDVIADLPWKSLQEVDWGGEATLRGIRFDAIPVKHFGWRYPWERDRSRDPNRGGRSWNAWLMRANGRKLVFGGDTAMTDSFAELAPLGGIDCAIMPIGAYDPWRSVHCTPEEAIEMALMMKAKTIVPIHCMTFRQGRDGFANPPRRFIAAMKETPTIKAGYATIGSTFVVPRLDRS